MNFNIGRQKDIYLSTTDVENLFINEYMTEAPGDYVKVYLLGLLYAQTRTELSFETMARTLNLTNFEINDAWDYWAKLGLVRKILADTDSLFNYDIEFVSLRDKMYSISDDENEDDSQYQGSSVSSWGQDEKKPVKASEPPLEKAAEAPSRPKRSQKRNREDIKDIYNHVEVLLGKPLSPQEMQTIASWVTTDGVSCEVIKVAYDYCYNINKKNVNYVGKVVADWKEKGFETAEQAKDHVDQVESNKERYRTVLRNLGIYRSPSEPERTEMDKWFDEMHFTMEKVLEACAQTISISNPNVKYVGKVLENWYSEAGTGSGEGILEPKVSRSVLNKYLEAIRLKAESDARKRKEKLYQELPKLAEIDSAIREESRSLSGGMAFAFGREKINALRERMRALEEQRAEILTENNYSRDYTDIKYSCDKCKDTCFTEDGLQCECTKQRIREADLWQNGKLEV